jgi:hypothetical protein
MTGNISPEVKLRESIIIALVYPKIKATLEEFKRDSGPAANRLDITDKEGFIRVLFDGIRKATTALEEEMIDKLRKSTDK